MHWNKYARFFKLEPAEVEQAIREFVARERPELDIARVEYSDRSVESRFHGRSGSVYDGYVVRINNAESLGLPLSS